MPTTADRPRGRSNRATVAAIARNMGADPTDPGAIVPCCLCGTPIELRRDGNDPSGPTIEHHVPLSKGGTNEPDNLALAHRACNVSRGNRPYAGPVDIGPTSRDWFGTGARRIPPRMET